MLIYSKPLTAEMHILWTVFNSIFKCTTLTERLMYGAHSSQKNTQEQQFITCSNIAFQWRLCILCSHSTTSQLLPMGNGKGEAETGHLFNGVHLLGPATLLKGQKLNENWTCRISCWKVGQYDLSAQVWPDHILWLWFAVPLSEQLKNPVPVCAPQMSLEASSTAPFWNLELQTAQLLIKACAHTSVTSVILRLTFLKFRCKSR